MAGIEDSKLKRQLIYAQPRVVLQDFLKMNNLVGRVEKTRNSTIDIRPGKCQLIEVKIEVEDSNHDEYDSSWSLKSEEEPVVLSVKNEKCKQKVNNDLEGNAGQKKKWNCVRCNAEYEGKGEFYHHLENCTMKSHDNKKLKEEELRLIFRCKLCTVSVSTFRDLVGHYQKAHLSINDGGQRHCPLCETVLQRQQLLYSHMMKSEFVEGYCPEAIKLLKLFNDCSMDKSKVQKLSKDKPSSDCSDQRTSSATSAVSDKRTPLASNSKPYTFYRSSNIPRAVVQSSSGSRSRPTGSTRPSEFPHTHTVVQNFTSKHKSKRSLSYSNDSTSDDSESDDGEIIVSTSFKKIRGHKPPELKIQQKILPKYVSQRKSASKATASIKKSFCEADEDLQTEESVSDSDLDEDWHM